VWDFAISALSEQYRGVIGKLLSQTRQCAAAQARFSILRREMLILCIECWSDPTHPMGHILTDAMKNRLLALIGAMMCAAMTPWNAAASEAVDMAYCLSAIDRFTAADRALIARSGANTALRQAATDSLAHLETSLARLRERFAAIPNKDGHATEAAAREARADDVVFLRHYEVCWNYCSDEKIGDVPWQACIARCRKADPMISRLDRCRAME
jgi:hypothetical protein